MSFAGSFFSRDFDLNSTKIDRNSEPEQILFSRTFFFRKRYILKFFLIDFEQNIDSHSRIFRPCSLQLEFAERRKMIPDQSFPKSIAINNRLKMIKMKLIENLNKIKLS
jgi:hypothetical protein